MLLLVKIWDPVQLPPQATVGSTMAYLDEPAGDGCAIMEWGVLNGNSNELRGG